MSREGYVDKRGNSLARARRRTWLLATFDVELGPDRARCAMRLSGDCLGEIDTVTLSVNRIEPGGSYARHNIEPACGPCQDLQGGQLGMLTYAWLLDSYRDARHAWERRFEEGTGRTYVHGIIAREQRRERRGGRREVTDFLEEDPAPTWSAWLRDNAGAAQQHAGDASSTLAG